MRGGVAVVWTKFDILILKGWLWFNVRLEVGLYKFKIC